MDGIGVGLFELAHQTKTREYIRATTMCRPPSAVHTIHELIILQRSLNSGDHLGAWPRCSEGNILSVFSTSGVATLYLSGFPCFRQLPAEVGDGEVNEENPFQLASSPRHVAGPFTFGSAACD